MQNYGSCLDESGTSKIPANVALEKCTELIKKLKIDQDKAKKWLENFYKEQW